ncbi:MAG: UDP-N-acetylglucosamine--N-acetylmuramyl-(pentapeptide) pyrophosphoryl-undecaprenol N-acetylglucosamine transferase [Candidatus Eremiobacter antarcticus]|nr:UDP-N-acetylglucosamine--N-acetylmuramyl-(pentapeptide) pyrophosphoryl-undecaprenol N-acetylglucosamine transferase [Candidatus Eremiobacteraeota bacterium]MBC5808353.1 UDP-N-acetylglucosamine--N-acetylmuramyl-(pentapeptide) pyrophosphoryl-undecaprenol N-acetylglucosamine transferase [Candidatus Eremiobacteraeota bacterium]
MRVLFTGGGTGGHLYPTLSLARALLRADGEAGLCTAPRAPDDVQAPSSDAPDEVLFIGARGKVDQKLLERDGIPHVTLGSSPLRGSSVVETVGGLSRNAVATAQAMRIVSRFRPDVVVASGGYASAPAVIASAWLRAAGLLRNTKIVLLEPNVIPGHANRRLARFADEVWGGYDNTGTSHHFREKFRLIGIPVRPELVTPLSQADARRSLGLQPDGFLVLVFGGSQGARTLNVATSGMVAHRRLPAHWQILHISGERDFEWMTAERRAEPNDNRYSLLPYVDDMALAYRAADLAVCRSGASTLAELAAVGLPAIFVPYPHAADNHQRANADHFVDHGAALIMQDELLTSDSLYWMLMDTAETSKLQGLQTALRKLSHPQALAVMVERIARAKVGSLGSAA